MNNTDMIDVASSISEEIRGRLKHKGFYDNRLSALEKFQLMEIEDMPHGLNIRTNLGTINYDTIFTEGTEVFTSSHQDLLDTRIKIMNLHEFMYSKDVSEEHKEKVLKAAIKPDVKKPNKLDYLHLALSNVKIVMFMDNFKMEETFSINRIITGNNYNHLIIIYGKEANVNVIINIKHPESHNNNSTSTSIITDFVDIIMDDYSKGNIVEFRNLNNNDVIYGRKTLTLGIGADSDWINIDKDSKIALIEQHARLLGNNSKSIMSNILCGKGSDYTLYNISEHTGENTESLMQNKCGLQTSKTIIRGLVKINDTAFNSNGYQKSDILMLDEKSRGISIPDLEIHNNQVKCTHGSTITRLDDEKIFYMQSRGINKKDASRILVEGFYDKILVSIFDEKLRNQVKEEILLDLKSDEQTLAEAQDG